MVAVVVVLLYKLLIACHRLMRDSFEFFLINLFTFFYKLFEQLAFRFFIAFHASRFRLRAEETKRLYALCSRRVAQRLVLPRPMLYNVCINCLRVSDVVGRGNGIFVYRPAGRFLRG